jgi:hypothetical protein
LGELLEAVASDETDGDMLRCGSCGALHERLQKTPTYTMRPVPPPPSDLARATSLTWVGHLEADGSVVFSSSGTGTPDDARRMADALWHLTRHGEERQRHLRGADRWTFRRFEGGIFWAHVNDQKNMLVPWRSGGRRPNRHGFKLPEQKCEACHVELPAGTPGYKPYDRSDGMANTVDWRGVRFCEPCVEAATEATARPKLVALDGGKARRA